MNRQANQSSTATRVAAVLALAISAIVVLVALVGAMSGGETPSPAPDGSPGKEKAGGSATKEKSGQASYEIKDGDTLTGISEKTGVPVTELEQLNPEIDPQALIAGQKLKLR